MNEGKRRRLDAGRRGVHAAPCALRTPVHVVGGSAVLAATACSIMERNRTSFGHSLGHNRMASRELRHSIIEGFSGIIRQDLLSGTPTIFEPARFSTHVRGRERTYIEPFSARTLGW